MHASTEPAQQPAARRTRATALAASLVGTTVEWYDFFLYSTAASLVFAKLFFPTGNATVGTLLSFATFAAGVAARPLGGVLFGHLGDRFGRKRSLAITMLTMGLGTAAIGLLPSYEQAGIWAPIALLTLRIVQGTAIGGEWAGAVLIAVEHAPAGRKGRYGAVPQIGLALGLALGTGLFAILSTVMTPAAFFGYGWRLAFLASLILVAVGATVRFKLAESPEFVAQTRQRAPIVELWRHRRSRQHAVLGMLARWGEGTSFNTWAVFALTYTTANLHLPRTAVLIGVTAAAILMAVLLPVSGTLTDRYGSRTVYGIGIGLYGIAVFPAFLGFNSGNLAVSIAVLVVALGVIQTLFYGGLGTLFASLFPAQTRYTGLSLVYQGSGVYASALTPMIMTALLAAGGGTPWLACGYLVLSAVVSVWATTRINRTHQHFTTGLPVPEPVKVAA